MWAIMFGRPLRNKGMEGIYLLFLWIYQYPQEKIDRLIDWRWVVSISLSYMIDHTQVVM